MAFIFYGNRAYFQGIVKYIPVVWRETHRQVTTVERVDDKGLVADVDDAADAIARMEGGRGAWVVFDSAVIVTVLNLLKIHTFHG